MCTKYDNSCSSIEDMFILFCSLWHCRPTRTTASSFLSLLNDTQQRSTVGRIPLDERSAHNSQTNVHAPGDIRTSDLSRRAAAQPPLRPRTGAPARFIYKISAEFIALLCACLILTNVNLSACFR